MSIIDPRVETHIHMLVVSLEKVRMAKESLQSLACLNDQTTLGGISSIVWGLTVIEDDLNSEINKQHLSAILREVPRGDVETMMREGIICCACGDPLIFGSDEQPYGVSTLCSYCKGELQAGILNSAEDYHDPDSEY